MQTCLNCRAGLPDGLATCTTCGTPLTPSSANPFAYVPVAAAPPPPPPQSYGYPPPPPGGYAPPPPGYGPPPPAGYPPVYGYPGGPPVGYGAPSTSTNVLAIISLVSGILFFLFVTPLVAVITGHIARRQIRERGEKGEGLAIAGLILGYFFLICAIAAIVIPVFLNHSHARDDADARADLRMAAVAEEINLTDHGSYTTSYADLVTAGYQASRGGALAIEVNGSTAYCLIGSHVAGPHWYLYDSQAGGLLPYRYSSPYAAEAACSLGPSGWVKAY